MTGRRREWPRVGELVIATVHRITDYGAYVLLDEYGGKEGLLHISEISSSWVRNIRDWVREGQKVVLKVIRVNPRRGHIDLSLRRVSDFEKKRKFLEWKRKRRARSILATAANRLNVRAGEVIEAVWDRLEGEFGEVLAGLEAVAEEGPGLLLELGVPEPIAKAVAEVARERMRKKEVKLAGVLTLSSLAPDGVNRIRKALLEAEEACPEGARTSIYIIGAPRYRVEITAGDYKLAERALRTVVERALEVIRELGGEGSFEREKK
ncbi:translation initiation factor IF-2 subunit alpha [Candidatus Bathyarchaeota archaeon]|nr:MAG: translation initiation factor IF-2 subunit alpha [Candidatus Bathyarchaeota archaeon]